jgi:hypothetical protein
MSFRKASFNGLMNPTVGNFSVGFIYPWEIHEKFKILPSFAIYFPPLKNLIPAHS